MAIDLHETQRVVGAKIRARRERVGLSQHKLAAKTGIERATITRLEQGSAGERGVAIGTLIRIANALGIDLADLFPRRRHA